MTNDWSKTRMRLFGATALVAAGTMSVGAQAQVVAGQSPGVSNLLDPPSAPDGDALQNALDSFDAAGGSLHRFDRPVYARFLPAGEGGISGPVINARHDGGVTPVPEPASWLTMLLGFGVSGAVLRRRAARRILA